jgi:hypothetical protein
MRRMWPNHRLHATPLPTEIMRHGGGLAYRVCRSYRDGAALLFAGGLGVT